MTSSPVSVGKRPEFRQSRSAGWGWPRLVPIQEQQSRLSQARQSSASPSLREHNKKEEPSSTMIATIISKMQGEEDAPLSPVPSAAGRSPPVENSVAGAADKQPYEHMPGSLLSVADLNDEGREAASRRDANPTSNSIEDLAGRNIADTKRGSVQDAAEKDFPTSHHGSVQDVAEKKASTPEAESAQDVADTSPGSERYSIQDPAEKNPPGSTSESLPDIAKKSSGSERGSVGDVENDLQDRKSASSEDVARINLSASEHGLIQDTVNQDDTETPVAYESTIVTDVPLKEEKPATPPPTPIPPVMDRVSVPSTSVPYYATPKIMVHKPSQSSEDETSTSRTIDQFLANGRQSLPQDTNPQIPLSTSDGNLIDEPPMQSMSLKPIAWQAPKDQKVQKRKLYLRKFRNAAARKTILKATLGRQLAIPTKQMLRLLANGENLTIPDLSKPGAEAATMLVPQEAVGSVTGAVLFPQGVEGAVRDE